MSEQVDPKLIKRIDTWKRAFADETTGILTTIEAMLWDHAVFGTAVKVVELAHHKYREDGGGRGQRRLNRMFFDLLKKGYWSSLLLGTRKLLDPGPLFGSRGVYSLQAILTDVRACRSKLTRRIYVEHIKCCSYDLDALREKNRTALMANDGAATWSDPAELACEVAHQDYDALSGVNVSDRQECDLIDLAVLDLIEKRLQDLSDVSSYVSTHIAHSGNQDSRSDKGLSEFDVRKAGRVLKALSEVAEVVGRCFANSGGINLATHLGDQFEGLDVAAVSKAEMSVLRSNWDAMRQKIESWNMSPADFLSSCGKDDDCRGR